MWNSSSGHCHGQCHFDNDIFNHLNPTIIFLGELKNGIFDGYEFI